MMRAGLCFICLVMVFGGSFAEAGLMTYNSRAAFNAAAPGLPVEDFEEGRFASFPELHEFLGPLTEAGANGFRGDVVFLPGEILPGLTIEAPINAELVLIGPPTFAPSKSIGPNRNGDTLNLSFDPGVKAIGLDLYPDPFPVPPFGLTISVFGPSGLLAIFPDLTETFFV